MASAAKKAGGEISLTAVIARRAKDGQSVLLMHSMRNGEIIEKIMEMPLDESSDRALDLYERLKKSKGEGGKYSHASLFLRANSRRGRVKFT